MYAIRSYYVSVPLPLDGSKPQMVYRSEEASPLFLTRTSTSEDGKVLMYGLMFTITEE